MAAKSAFCPGRERSDSRSELHLRIQQAVQTINIAGRLSWVPDCLFPTYHIVYVIFFVCLFICLLLLAGAAVYWLTLLPRMKEVLGLNLSWPDSLCVEFAYSPRALRNLFGVLQLPATLNDMHVRLDVLRPLPLIKALASELALWLPIAAE